MNLSEYIIDFLKQVSVEHVFGISGARIETFFHEIHKSEINISLVTAKHEFSAAAMASSYAWSGKSLGVVSTTSGGAAYNIIPALAEAYCTGTPLLAIIGQPANNRNLYGAFQETSGLSGTPDLIASFKPVSRFCAKIGSADEIPEIIKQVYKLLILEKSGPAVLLIPENLFICETGGGIFEWPLGKPDSAIASNTSRQRISAGRTVFIAGRDILRAGARNQFSGLVKRMRCPLVSAPDAKEVFDNFSPLYRGTIGVMGNPSAHEAVERADTVIIAGTDMNETATYGLREILSKKNILYAGKLPVHLTKFTHISRSIMDGIRYISENIEAEEEDIHGDITYLNSTGSPYARIMKIIEKDIVSPSNISVDAGYSGIYAVHTMKIPEGSSFHISLSTAGMGYSFGDIIGAAVATGRKGYLIAGDGSFFMNGFEIHTAVELSLPVIFIILDNSGHRTCSLREKIYFNEISGSNDFRDICIGKGFNEIFPSLKSADVQTPEELEYILKENRELGSPLLISIKIDNEEIPPYRPLFNKRS